MYSQCTDINLISVYYVQARIFMLIIYHTSVLTASLISECEASGAQAIHSTTCSCSRNSALHSLVAVTQTLTVCNIEQNPGN